MFNWSSEHFELLAINGWLVLVVTIFGFEDIGGLVRISAASATDFASFLPFSSASLSALSLDCFFEYSSKSIYVSLIDINVFLIYSHAADMDDHADLYSSGSSVTFRFSTESALSNRSIANFSLSLIEYASFKMWTAFLKF